MPDQPSTAAFDSKSGTSAASDELHRWLQVAETVGLPEMAHRLKEAANSRNLHLTRVLTFAEIEALMSADQPSTAALTWSETEIARKRETVGMASTVLDPLPSTRTTDTAIILQALDSAIELLDHTESGATGLSSRGLDVRSRLADAAFVVRARIRQKEPR